MRAVAEMPAWCHRMAQPSASRKMSSQPRSSMLLVDAEALMHKAFHAGKSNNAMTLHSFCTGEDTTATLIFTRSLLNALAVVNPSHCALVTGGHEQVHTWRHELSNGSYKSTRQHLEPGMEFAFRRMLQVARVCFRLPEHSGASDVEADDVIATLACRTRAAGLPVSIFSHDKDFNQLLDDNGDVCVRWIKNQELVNFTHLDLHDSYGLYPSQFADYLALAGDKSDNVEGVQGIGPKRAIQLLKQYGTLEGVFKALERHRESCEAFVPKSAIGPLSQDGAYEQAIKCRKLCSLVTDASEVSQSIQSLAWDPAECNSEECQALLFDELSFESLREPMNALKQGKPLPQSI